MYKEMMIFTVQTGKFVGTRNTLPKTKGGGGEGEGNQKSILLVMSTSNMSNFIDENKIFLVKRFLWRRKQAYQITSSDDWEGY